MAIPASFQRHIASSWRHRWIALIVAWAICVAGWISVLLLPSQYQSSAKLYADSDVILGQLLRGLAVDQMPANQVEILTRTLLSRTNLETVINRTDLDQRVTDAASREGLITRLGEEVKVTQQARNLFTIAYTDSDPRMARDVVRTLLDIFMEAAARSDRRQMEQARTFVNQQLAAYEVQLREAERRRAEFRARNIDLLPVDGIPRMEASRAKLMRLRGDLEDAKSRRALLQSQLEATRPSASSSGSSSGAPALVMPPVVNADATRLADAERSLRELQLRFTEQHPDVVATRRLVAELRAAGAGNPSRSPATAATQVQTAQVHEALKIRVLEFDAAMASLERQIREEEAEMARLETTARSAFQLHADMLNLDRDYEVLRKNYEELLGRRESVQIAGAARAGADRLRLEIVDPPQVPKLPSGPNRVLFAVGVLLAGLGAGAALALALGQLDSSFYSLHDLRRIGLPVLGGVSRLRRPRREIAAIFVFAWGFASLLAVFGGILVGGERLAQKLPQLITTVSDMIS